MDNLRIFIYLQSQNRKCGSREIADNLGIGLRKTQYILKKMRECGFLEVTTGTQNSYKIKVSK